MKTERKLEKTKQREITCKVQIENHVVVMQELPSTEYVIQEDLKKEPRREHQKEDTFEVIINNH